MRIFVRNGQQPEPPREVEVRVRKIARADRCDRCRAQAFALATVKGIDLLFCGHHFARFEEALRAVAERVIDEREWINRRPSPSG